MAFFSLASKRTILPTETDADSPLSEELMSQLRENAEALQILAFSTGVTGALTSDPPNDTTGVATDTGNFSIDAHNGRTLLFTSGLAIGDMYTIDDTTVDALICTGDNLYTDGVRSADTYEIFYDIKNNTDGHDHNGTNSKYIAMPTAYTSSLPSYCSDTPANAPTGGSFDTTNGIKFKLRVGQATRRLGLDIRAALGTLDSGSGYIRLRIDSLVTSTSPAIPGISYVDLNFELDITSLAPGLYDGNIQMYRTSSAAYGINYTFFQFYF